jgi:amino acid transporter
MGVVGQPTGFSFHVSFRHLVKTIALATSSARITYGTFKGVFVPTTLTILGIILFLRLPWVVGNAGLGGAALIILTAAGITLLTSLSLSSIVTNMRIGAGGAFSIISRSLGLEIGGSIGIPLYLSQAVAVAMYIFGFREGWLWIFPDHPALVVDLGVFAVLVVVAIVSTNFAFKLQYGILAIIILAFVSIGIGFFQAPAYQTPELFGSYTATDGESTPGFWVVFAVFFPAVTGIMAGLNMSGELTSPRINIPNGTLLAVVLTTVIYLLMAAVAGFLGSGEELRGNYLFFIDAGYLPEVVMVGLLGSTLSSGLTSLIGAPRVLYAMAQTKILPFQKVLLRTNRRGEPVGSIAVTALLVLVAILLRQLNVIAPLITLFFLITYAMINLVVLIEQSLSLPSFRPTFSVPLIVPLLGALSSFIVMFIVNSTFSIIAIIFVVLFYAYLSAKHLQFEGGYARSGLFVAMAQWATKRAESLARDKAPRAWQPDLLLPISQTREIRASYKLLHSLIYPKGSLKILGINAGDQLRLLERNLPTIVETLKTPGSSVSYSFIESKEFAKSVEIGTESLGAAFFKPNTLFLKLDSRYQNLEDYQHILTVSREHKWGVLVYLPFASVGLGLEKTINLWLTHVPDDWEENMELGNNDLAVLVAILLQRNWPGSQLNIVYEKQGDTAIDSREFIRKIQIYTRLPKGTAYYTVNADDRVKWDKLPQADLTIRSTHRKIDINEMLAEVVEHRSSYLFTMDSGKENAQV